MAPSKAQKEYEAFRQQTIAAMKQERADSDALPKKLYLSDLQIEKLSKYFDLWFDNDHDGVITKKDFEILNERILKYTGWKPTSGHARVISEMHNSFWSCLMDAAHRYDFFREKNQVDLDAWLDMWGGMVVGAMSMRNFPYWVQLLPSVMFLIIDRDEDGHIGKNELKRFYKEFMGVEADKVDKLTDVAYSRMTGNGDFHLNNDLYSMVFANFLLGRTFAGPGQYIFGIFKTTNEDQPMHIIIPEEDPEEAVGLARKKSRAHFLIQQATRASYDD